MSPPGARLTCAEAATVTAAPGEPLGAEAVVVVPLVLLHVALPVELRSRVSPVAVEHDPDAVELEARLLPHHRHAERPAHAGGEDLLGVSDVPGTAEAPALLGLAPSHLVDQPLQILTHTVWTKNKALDAAVGVQLGAERAGKLRPRPAAVQPVGLVQLGIPTAVVTTAVAESCK